MSRRIEVYDSGKDAGSHKYSKNEKFAARGAGVDIEKDPSGGGGTSDYNQLTNLPSINGHVLVGENDSDEDLDISPLTTQQLDAIMALI